MRPTRKTTDGSSEATCLQPQLEGAFGLVTLQVFLGIRSPDIVYCRVLAVTIASEIAAVRPDVKGSGTFLPALIDELGKLTPEVIASKAKIEVVQ